MVLLYKISTGEAEKEPSVVKCLLRKLCDPKQPQTEEKMLEYSTFFSIDGHAHELGSMVMMNCLGSFRK